jgi:hypothetical protein
MFGKDAGEVRVDEAGFEFAGAPDVEEVLRRIDELPAPPAVAARVLSLALEDGADFADLARLIESDQSLALKVLRQANSLAYGCAPRWPPGAAPHRARLAPCASGARHRIRGSSSRTPIRRSPAQGPLRHRSPRAVACGSCRAVRPGLAGEPLREHVARCGQLALLRPGAEYVTCIAAARPGRASPGPGDRRWALTTCWRASVWRALRLPPSLSSGLLHHQSRTCW